MTKYESAVISAYTGYLCGNFSDMHMYAEKLLDRPIFTHEFGSKDFAEELKMASYDDFVKICKDIK